MRPKNSYSFGYLIALIFTGLGIGWLTGLSISPVVSIVITSVAGSAAAIIAAMSGLENQPKAGDDGKAQSRNIPVKINPTPIALLVFGIVIGSAIGIYVRSHNWLGDPNLSKEIEQWTELGLNKEEVARRLFENRYSYRGWLGTDLSAEVQKWTDQGLTNKEEVVRRLFESTYPLDYEVSTNPTLEFKQNSGAAALFSIEATECGNLYKALARSPEELVKELDKIESLKELPNIVNDPQTLEKIVTEVLCP